MSEDVDHVIIVPARGHVMCSCAGVGWCSHIDATLVAGERHMVPTEDRITANQAQIAARGRIGAPEDWKAHWRKNRAWRGLPPAQWTMLDKSREAGIPMVSLEGRGSERKKIELLSEDAGWMVSKRYVKGCLFHIAPSIEKVGLNAEHALAAGVAVVSYEQWRGMAHEIVSTVIARIRLASAKNEPTY